MNGTIDRVIKMMVHTPTTPTPLAARRRPARSPRYSAAGRSGMTLVELLLSAVVIAMMLGGVTLVSQSLRNDACDQKTRSTLRQLRAALQAYRDQHAAWPTGPATANAVQTLLDDETTAAIVRTLDLGTDPQGRVCIHDGYGRPVRYVVQSRHDTTGSADFVSAGANGRFGDLSSHDAHERDLAADNLYGSDLEMPSP